MQYDIQLYSVRDVSEKDLNAALMGVSKLGYQSIEFAGFFGHSAKEVAQMLRQNGLSVSGTHTGLNALTEQYDETVRFHHEIGASAIIIPYAELDTREKIDAFVKQVNELKPRLEKDGLRLGYHNHAHEFKVNSDGSIPYDAITDKTELFLEIDTFWAYVAGKDPVALMKQFHKRLPVIHIKDGLSDGKGMPLGKGQAPVKAVYEAATAMGIHMVVESETLTPDGLTEAKECIEYLKALA